MSNLLKLSGPTVWARRLPARVGYVVGPSGTLVGPTQVAQSVGGGQALAGLGGLLAVLAAVKVILRGGGRG